MEKYGICLQTLIPLRKDPSEQSEMVSQVLFGECYEIIDHTKKWCQIICAFDQYSGWIDIKQLSEINEVQFEKFNKNYSCSQNGLDYILINRNKSLQPLVAGSSLPIALTEGENADCTYNSDTKNNITDFVSAASQFLHAPYLWGGKTILGIDCSGLSQIVYKIMGITLPRDASQQVGLGNSISFINEAQAGDLAFFDNDEGQITHVGIIISPNQIIHASGKVRIDKIDHQGIFNVDTNKYSHKLRVIKRITA